MIPNPSAILVVWLMQTCNDAPQSRRLLSNEQRPSHQNLQWTTWGWDICLALLDRMWQWFFPLELTRQLQCLYHLWWRLVCLRFSANHQFFFQLETSYIQNFMHRIRFNCSKVSFEANLHHNSFIYFSGIMFRKIKYLEYRIHPFQIRSWRNFDAQYSWILQIAVLAHIDRYIKKVNDWIRAYWWQRATAEHTKPWHIQEGSEE